MQLQADRAIDRHRFRYLGQIQINKPTRDTLSHAAEDADAVTVTAVTELQLQS